MKLETTCFDAKSLVESEDGEIIVYKCDSKEVCFHKKQFDGFSVCGYELRKETNKEIVVEYVKA